MRAALGLDVGTTSVKAVVVGENGELVGEGRSGTLPMRAPANGWAVQQTADLRDAVIECLREATSSLPTRVEVACLTAAVQSGSVATIDRSGTIADDLTTWMDTRAEPIVEEWIEDGTANAIRRVSGWTVHPGQGLPQLAWIKANDQSTWDSIGHIAAVDDLVTHWLTNSWVTNPSSAAGMALLDISTGEWSEELAGLLDIAPEWMSEVRPCGARVGTITAEVAAATGLNENVAVVNGGHDQTCTALALGVTEPAQAVLAGGTAWVLTSVVPVAETHAIPKAMNVSFHVLPDLRTASKYLGGMGASIEWIATTGDRSPDRSDRFFNLDAQLADTAIKETSPYFQLAASDTPDAASPGAGKFLNATPDTTDAKRARAIMEYAAFTVKTSLLGLREAQRPQSLTVVGGVTRSPGWTQLIADVCELPINETAEASLPAIGAAMLGGVSQGVFSDFEAAARSLSVDTTALSPDLGNAGLYQRRYQTHLTQELNP